MTGIVHERNFEQNTASLDFGCDMDIINLQLKKTNIVAEYELIDSIKYYIKTTQKPRILKTDRVEKLKQGESSIFNAKYSKLKSENNLESISIYFQIIISHEGEILDIKFLNTFPVVNAKEYIEDINHDLESFISHFPEINPAQFYGQKVYCRVLDFIKF